MSESANTRLLKMKEKNDSNKVIMTLMIGEMEFQKMVGRNWLGNSGDDWPHETSITAREGTYGTDEVWHEAITREAIENWFEGGTDPPRMRQTVIRLHKSQVRDVMLYN